MALVRNAFATRMQAISLYFIVVFLVWQFGILGSKIVFNKCAYVVQVSFFMVVINCFISLIIILVMMRQSPSPSPPKTVDYILGNITFPACGY